MNKVGIGIIFAIGIVLLIGGSVFVGIFPQILKNKIKEELPLTNGSDAYDRWRETKVPVTMKFYFYHVKNSDNFTSLDDIEFEEKGPYVYDEKRFKPNDKIKKVQDHDDMLSYQESRTYTFIKNSELNETDELTFINFPILGLLQNKLLDPFFQMTMAQNYKKFYPKGVLSAESGLLRKSQVVKFLFEGMEYKIFKELSALKVVKPTFAIFEQGKAGLEEEWSVNTGKNDIDQIGQVTSFDNKKASVNSPIPVIGKNLEIWPLHPNPKHNCSQLRGTDGTLFAPSVSDDQVLYSYEPQLCRTVFFHYWKETEVRGITTYRYRVPDQYFQSPSNNPENTCYCVEKDLKDCNHNGILDISHCWRRTSGAPIAMSAPYFNHGDKELRDTFRLKPKRNLDDDNYGTYVDIEPMTGTTLKAVRRLQMNIIVEPKDYENMPELKKSTKPRYVVPVFWIEESGEADEDQADLFKSMVINKKKLANGISITVIVVGAIMTIASIYLFIKNK